MQVWTLKCKWTRVDISGRKWMKQVDYKSTTSWLQTQHLPNWVPTLTQRTQHLSIGWVSKRNAYPLFTQCLSLGKLTDRLIPNGLSKTQVQSGNTSAHFTVCLRLPSKYKQISRGCQANSQWAIGLWEEGLQWLLSVCQPVVGKSNGWEHSNSTHDVAAKNLAFEGTLGRVRPWLMLTWMCLPNAYNTLISLQTRCLPRLWSLSKRK